MCFSEDEGIKKGDLDPEAVQKPDHARNIYFLKSCALPFVFIIN